MAELSEIADTFDVSFNQSLEREENACNKKGRFFQQSNGIEEKKRIEKYFRSEFNRATLLYFP